jgi:hypothetical protein
VPINCACGVPEPVERYVLQGVHRWHVEWVEVIGIKVIVRLSDPVLLSLQTIMGLTEEPRNPLEDSRHLGQYRSIAWRSSMRGRLRALRPISCGPRWRG